MEKHGAISAAAEAPASKAKDHLIDVSRSEGQQLAYDLGVAVANSETPIILTDRGARNWVAEVRQLATNDPRLETPLTIRTELINAGLQQVGEERKTRGRRWRAYANEAALKDTEKTPEQMIQEHKHDLNLLSDLITKLEAAAAATEAAAAAAPDTVVADKDEPV